MQKRWLTSLWSSSGIGWGKPTLTWRINMKNSWTAVADPGFSPGGGANSQNCYYFSHFCRKLHENERIWTPRGGRASLAPPLGSANGLVLRLQLEEGGLLRHVVSGVASCGFYCRRFNKYLPAIFRSIEASRKWSYREYMGGPWGCSGWCPRGRGKLSVGEFTAILALPSLWTHTWVCGLLAEGTEWASSETNRKYLFYFASFTFFSQNASNAYILGK